MGRSLLRTWLLRPSLSISVIRSRQDAVVCFLRSENTVTSNAMHNHLKGLKNVPRLLGLIKDGRAKLSDWQGLVKVNFFQFWMTSWNWWCFFLVYVLCHDAPRCNVWPSRSKRRWCLEESKPRSILWLDASLKIYTALGCTWYHDLQRDWNKNKWYSVSCVSYFKIPYLFSFLDWLGRIIMSRQSLCTTTHWWRPRQQETHLSWNWLRFGAFEIHFCADVRLSFLFCSSPT